MEYLMPSAEEVIRTCEDKVQTIKKRLYYLTPIQEQLKTVHKLTGQGIRNDILYQMVVDSYDMLVIDVASLCKGMYTNGGFFNHIKHHVARLKKLKRSKIVVAPAIIVGDGADDPEKVAATQASIAEHMKARIEQRSIEVLKRLFPDYEERKDRPFNHSDIDKLMARFKNIHDKVIADRDSNRAHRYENEDSRAERLPLSALEFHFKELEILLNDLRYLILDCSSFRYNNLNLANTERTAKDIADLICHGSINQVLQAVGITQELQNAGRKPPYYWKIRDDYYENLADKKVPEGG
jgi:hypothetical protein